MNSLYLILWHLGTCLAAGAEDGASQKPVYDEAADNGTFGYYPVRTYATAAEVTSPKTNFLQWDERCDDGLYYFITPRGWALTNPGPMILDRQGELIWSKHFDNDFGGQAYDFMVQTYRGRDYLTFWLGDDRVRGHGSGFYYMLDSSYNTVYKMGAANGLSADLHEFLLTPQGTALMTMYEIVPHDVSDFRAFDPENPDDQSPNYIWDCIFQEVSVDTGDLVFEWRASEHFSINDTYHNIELGGTLSLPFDWFHINSVEKDSLGNYLVSARYTHSLTYIDGTTGDIIWTLGGKRNDFMDLSNGYGINFAWQHDARFLLTDAFPNIYDPPPTRPGRTTRLLTLFDNAAEDLHYDYGLEYSRGMLVEITYPTPKAGQHVQHAGAGQKPKAQPTPGKDDNLNVLKVENINGSSTDYTVRLIKSYENPKAVRSSSQGSMQILPQGPGRDPKILVGYGLNAVWTEFDSNGTVLCDVHFGADTSWERGDIQSYRAYKFAWTGFPQDPPSVDISDDDVEVYVSWNGATEVTDWILQCSETDAADEKAWADVVRVRKQGFETIIPLPAGLGDSRYLRVIAIDKHVRRLPNGASATMDRGHVLAYFPLTTNGLPSAVSTTSPLKVFTILVAIVTLLLIAYELYRRYLSWRHGRPGAGPLRWRKGFHYRLLSES